MCNLYSMTTAQAAIREIAEVMTDHTGDASAWRAVNQQHSDLLKLI